MSALKILRLQQEFETSGWCFVSLSQNTCSSALQLNHINQSLSNFFILNQGDKFPYSSSNAFGYTHVGQLISNLTYRLKALITRLAVSDHKTSEQVELSICFCHA
jgi:hypothetical protein